MVICGNNAADTSDEDDGGKHNETRKDPKDEIVPFRVSPQSPPITL